MEARDEKGDGRESDKRGKICRRKIRSKEAKKQKSYDNKQ